jgi:type III pantothenate kinase
MNRHIVVDVGNSRLKWGRCEGPRVAAAVSLPLDDRSAWSAQAHEWHLSDRTHWTIAGVNPPAVERFVEWLRERATAVRILEPGRDLSIQIAVEQPDRVGIDRLLNAVAANARNCDHRPAILIDAGSAVTVDLVDAAGIFRGGAIFPGLRLMAQALHGYTAKLPLIDVAQPPAAMPGTSTAKAMHAGVFGAVVGGIRQLTRQLSESCSASPVRYLTGGDALLLASALDEDIELWPYMTLEGVRLAAPGES